MEEERKDEETPDVEGHVRPRVADGSEPPEKEKRESEEPEGPDVEGHLRPR